jgi:ADP-ribosylglycohydrolase
MNHSLINAAIVIMALIKGQGDFTRTVGISVMAGRDTDCNGATAGSIMGCALGRRGIPAHWSEPLHDTVRTELAAMPAPSISDLARRTWEIARRNRNQEPGTGNQ